MPRKKRKAISELISLKGRKTLITGAASGIGEAIALRFAEAGSNLELVDINEELLKKVEKVFSLNFESVFRMCQKMIKGKLNKGGVIVNIASIEAITPFKNDLSVYSASKGGVITLTRTLAKEFGKKFRVNAVVPGGIMTQTTKELAKKLYKLEGEYNPHMSTVPLL